MREIPSDTPCLLELLGRHTSGKRHHRRPPRSPLRSQTHAAAPAACNNRRPKKAIGHWTKGPRVMIGPLPHPLPGRMLNPLDRGEISSTLQLSNVRNERAHQTLRSTVGVSRWRTRRGPAKAPVDTRARRPAARRAARTTRAAAIAHPYSVLQRTGHPMAELHPQRPARAIRQCRQAATAVRPARPTADHLNPGRRESPMRRSSIPHLVAARRNRHEDRPTRRRLTLEGRNPGRPAKTNSPQPREQVRPGSGTRPAGADH